jgi:alpha-D-ribose 1-methylphosphonate 5-triphosphate synthase subunit PhnH
MTLEAGFGDPVRDAQVSFRALLNAMSHPGRVALIEGIAPPAPLGVAAGAALLTLVDHETKLWLDPEAAAAREWIAFHCGAPIVDDPSACSFALALSLPDLGRLSPGTHEEPETSATIICQIAAIGTGRVFRLTGPGLREPALFGADGLPPDFVSIWRRNHARFPCGVDLILCAGDLVTALPRTVAIEEV